MRSIARVIRKAGARVLGMGVFVAAVLFRVNLCRVGHEASGMQCVRVGQQRIVSALGVIAELVPLGGELVKVCSGTVVFGCEPMRLDG
jgi:hypothetical protein